MRRVAYALTASVALMIGALTPASAGCYGECNGYQESYRSGSPSYERYSDRPYYGDRSYSDSSRYEGSRYSSGSSYYSGSPRYHTTYYERGEEYPVGGYSSNSYDDGYSGGYGSYRRYSDYDRPYSSGYSNYGNSGYGYRGYSGGYGYGGGYGYRGYGGGYGYSSG